MESTTGIINEEWRSINGFINYQVSNIGRVRNVKTGRIFNQNLDTNGYCYVKLRQDNEPTNCRLQRLVAKEFLDNPQNKPFVDHIDRNKLNNCINNLRWATNQENQMNSTKTKNKKTSKYKGFSWFKACNKWKAQIKLNGKSFHLGYFDNEKDAARAYNNKALELFCEFANLNEISDDD